MATCVMVCCIGVFADVATASAGWGHPVTVTEGGTQYGFSQDVAANGDGMIVWSAPSHGSEGFTVSARTISPAGALGPVQAVSEATAGAAFTSAYAPAVRYSSDGTATVVWLESVYGSDSCFNGSPGQSEPGDETSCEVDEYVKARQIASNGSLSITHQIYHRHVVYPTEGTFGGGDPSYVTYGQPLLGTGPGGSTTLVWTQSSFGAGCTAYGYSSSYSDSECEASETVQWVRLSAAGVPSGEPQPVYTENTIGYGAGQPLLRLKLGVAADGSATLLFSARRDVGESECWGGESTVDLVRISSGGAATVAKELDSGCGAAEPQLVVQADGSAVAVWGWAGTYSADEALFLRISSAGVPAAVEPLLGEYDGSRIAGFDVARGIAGSATAVWSADGTVKERQIPPAGALGAVKTVAVPGSGHYFQSPRLALAADGSGAVIWEDDVTETNFATGVDGAELAADGSPGPVRILLAANRRDHGARVSAGASGSLMTSWRVSAPHANKVQAVRLNVEATAANDDFLNAEALDPSLPSFAAGSNEGATKQAGEPDHAGDAGGASVWYSWTAAESGPVAVATCSASSLDSLLAVYTGSALSGLTAVASADGGAGGPCASGDSEVRFEATAGTTYRIAVDGKAGSTGSFGLKLVSRQDAPANDDFSAARNVGATPFWVTGKNVDAAKETGEPNHAGNAGGASVWYRWTPSQSGEVVITACGYEPGFHPLLGVYTGAAPGALTPVASDDGSSSSCERGSRVRIDAVAGTTYRVAVDGRDGREGRFSFQLLQVPSNDDFDDAESIAGVPDFVSGSTYVASKQAGEPNHAGDPGGASVWYSWTPSTSGTAIVSACLFASDPALLAVYTGADVAHLTAVAADAGTGPKAGCFSGYSRVRFPVSAGTTYHLAVDGKGGEQSTFSLALEMLPGNDDFGSAQVIAPSLPQFVSSNNRYATKQAGEPNHGGDPGGASLWYSWTPTTSGTVIVSVSCPGGPSLPLLGVYTGSAVDHLTTVASAGGSSCKSSVSIDAKAGTTYRIAVDGKGGEENFFSLAIESLPGNDDFADAQEIPGTTPQFISGSNRHASKQAGEPNHAGDPGGASVWYSWTPSASGTAIVSACLFANRGALLAVYTGSDVAHLTSVGTQLGGSSSNCFSTRQEVRLEFSAGTRYYIAVDGREGESASFSLNIEQPLGNDDFAAAQQIAGSPPFPFFGSNLHASKQSGEPNHGGAPGGASVWYSWTAPKTATVAVTICAFSGFEPLIGVYTGSDLSSLTTVASAAAGPVRVCPGTGETRARFKAQEGTTYKIAVDAANGAQSFFTLLFETAPVNDDFEFGGGQTISPQIPQSFGVTNLLASKQAGEPNHGGDPGGASVWYPWTASVSGPVRIVTCHANFDAIVAVYTGAALGSLSEVGSSTGGGCGANDTALTFNATEGIKYRIAVDGVGGAEGSLTLDLYGRATNDAFDQAEPLADGDSRIGSNFQASKQAGEPNHAGDPGGASVWYSWTAPLSARYRLSACGGEIEPLLGIYTGGSVGALSAVPTSAGICSASGPVPAGGGGGAGASGKRIRFDAVAGTTYHFAVDGKAGAQGLFQLELSLPPDTSLGTTPAAHSPSPNPAFSYYALRYYEVDHFDCSLDGAAFGLCPSGSASYSGLADGPHEFRVRAVSSDGDADPSPASWTWTVDTVPPGTALKSGPSGAVASAIAQFDYAGEPATDADHFECSLDGATFALCPLGSTSYSGLLDGEHSFEVRAVDAAGNVDPSPATRAWKVDTTPPDTSIAGGPTGTVAVAAATLEFAGAPESDVDHFECRLDAAPFAVCPGTKRTYPSLADGQHTFAVRAVDAVGNVDPSQATRTWTVDTTPPSTTFESGPPAATQSTSATVAFAANEVATFECSFDSSPFAACGSPQHFAALADGKYSLRVRATDAVGNVAEPVEMHWTVDTVPPDTVIASGPVGVTADPQAAFSFEADEPEARFECRLDGATFAPCSSISYPSLADGEHSFAVRAVDPAGNVDPTPATRSWRVDTAPPDTSLDSGPTGTISVDHATFTYSGQPKADVHHFECSLDEGQFVQCPATGVEYDSLADGDHRFEVRAVDAVGNVDGTPAARTFSVESRPPQTSITAGPSAVTSDTSPSFGFESDEAGSSFECSLDGAPFAACDSPRGYSGLGDGPHQFAVRAIDSGGSPDPSPAVLQFTVDTVAPDTAIDQGPAALETSSAADFSFGGEPEADAARFECRLDGGAFAPCASGVEYHHLVQGGHTFEVRAVDVAGNPDPSPAQRSWTIDFSGDASPPQTTIIAGPEGEIGDPNPSFAFESSERDSSFECSLDGVAPSACESPLSLSGLSGGTHSFAVAARDPAGNLDPSPSLAEFSVDAAVPDASLGVGEDSGAAPLATTISVAGSDAEGDQLEFRLEFGDGGVVSGDLPHADLTHTYAKPGSYLVQLQVTDGFHEAVTVHRVEVGLPEPLQADAGDDQTVVAGSSVRLDGGDSRPQIGIDDYSWEFSDGGTAVGPSPSHVFAEPGTYTAKLRVGAGSKSATDEAKIRVLPDTAPRLDVDVSSGGAPLGDADVLVLDADGQRYPAVTDAAGHAAIRGLPDGEYAVYAAHPGYIDTSVVGTVSGGTGRVEIPLQPGETGVASSSSKRLTLDEIEALGIDTSDPDNQNVYEFAITLTFRGSGSEFRGFVGGRGVGGSGGGGWGLEVHVGDEWNPCQSPCSGGGWWLFPQLGPGGVPTLEALRIPGRASFLKEFFAIEMLVQNLGGPGIALRHGEASLQLPDGLSLAPTASPQHVSQTLPDIGSGKSALARWIVRGDKEGSYSPTAFYSGVVSPFERPLSLEATVGTPLKVWGGSALKMIVQPENRVTRYRPYRVKVGLKNVADIPVYNPAVELLKEGKINYIYQPRERLRQGTAVVEPGQTFWTDDYVLVPAISGTIVPSQSFVEKTGGNVDLDDEILPVPQKPAAGVRTHPLKDSVVLEFQQVEGASSYEVYGTSPNLNEEFPDQPLPETWRAPNKVVVPADSDAGPRLFAISTVKPNGVHTMYHEAVVDSSLDYWPTPETHLSYDSSCGSPITTLTFRFKDPDFDLSHYHVKIGNGAPQDGVIPATDRVDIPAGNLTDGTKVVAWATNTKQEEEGGGEHGPVLEEEVEGCHYVALGDSFSSGEGVPSFEAGTDVSDVDTCHRSNFAYSHKLAGILPQGWTKPIYRACSGAVLADLLSKNQGDPPFQIDGEPEGPQIDQLGANVQLVTIGIGGNDVYFKEILESCEIRGWASLLGGLFVGPLSLKLAAHELIPVCKPSWAHKVDDAIDRLRQDLPTAYKRIQAKIADDARLIVVGYPQLFPSVHSDCWGITPSDVDWLHDTVERANRVIRDAALSVNATFVPTADRFAGHSVCLPTGGWFNIPRIWPNFEYSFHPDRKGQEEMGEAVVAAYDAGAPGTASHIDLGQTISQTTQVGINVERGIFSTSWEGSTVETTLISPSGRHIKAGSFDSDVSVATGPTHEVFTVEEPEAGTWTIESYGADIHPGGEMLHVDTTQVQAEPEPPTALFTLSTHEGPPPDLPVTLDGSGSFGGDGQIVSYQWAFGDGTSGSGSVVQHTYHGPGVYHPVLTVKDDKGQVNSYEGEAVLVTNPPTAAGDSYRTFQGQTLTLGEPGLLANDTDPDGEDLAVVGGEEPGHGQASFDPDGAIVYEPEPGFTGTDTLKYVAIDDAGAVSQPATVTIKVKPAFDTQIDSGPNGQVASAAATFTYSAPSAVAGGHFECSLDAGPFSSCPDAGRSYSGLADGPHTFAARVVDGDGDSDPTPASRSFSVDMTPPDTQIVAGPEGSTTSASPAFSFSSEPGATFQCRLDSILLAAFQACASPKSYSALGSGAHRFEVRAIDALGNVDQTPAARDFSIVAGTQPTSPTSPASPADQVPPAGSSAPAGPATTGRTTKHKAGKKCRKPKGKAKHRCSKKGTHKK